MRSKRKEQNISQPVNNAHDELRNHDTSDIYTVANMRAN